jgi:Ca-activated chloride channel family protein
VIASLFVSAGLLAPALASRAPAAGDAGQQPPPQPGGHTPPEQETPVFKVGLEVVNLTATVTTKDRKLVTDLSADDFEIFEDGRPQKIQVFGRAYPSAAPRGGSARDASDDEMAIDLGMLMDTSQSMLKELKLAKETATRFLDAIPRARDLLTLFFDQDIQVSRYDSEYQQGLIERIQTIKGGGWTVLYDAIAVYLSRVQDTGGRQVLVLFTDGDDSRSQTTLQEMMELVRSSTVTIYPIAFTGSLPQSKAAGPRAVLQGLAEMTGGEVFTPSRSQDLAEIFKKILDQLRSQYVLGFVSDNPARDGKYRRLRVEVKGEGLRVRHREGYYAAKDETSGSER